MDMGRVQNVSLILCVGGFVKEQHYVVMVYQLAVRNDMKLQSVQVRSLRPVIRRPTGGNLFRCYVLAECLLCFADGLQLRGWCVSASPKCLSAVYFRVVCFRGGMMLSVAVVLVSR